MMRWSLGHKDYEALRTISLYSSGKESTSNLLARHMNISLTMALKHISKFKKLKLIDIAMSTNGRVRCYKLTKLGEILTDSFEKMQVMKK